MPSHFAATSPEALPNITGPTAAPILKPVDTIPKVFPSDPTGAEVIDRKAKRSLDHYVEHAKRESKLNKSNIKELRKYRQQRGQRHDV